MKYIFILGNNPGLSASEIENFFAGDTNVKSLRFWESFCLLESSKKIDTAGIIKKLGGTVKIAECLTESNKIKKEIFIDILDAEISSPPDYKYKFGFSLYGRKKINFRATAMELKKYLKEKGISSRWVSSQEKSLSSVIVEQNKMIEKGIDFNLVEKEGKILLGKTVAVQDFKGLSGRDYGRPQRDDVSGMLPPKLAQTMLNIAGAGEDKSLLDPFCGSGTVLLEASLLGLKKIFGSDISQKAVEDSKKNISWARDKFALRSEFKIFQIDALKISNKIPPKSVDIIVTEPYLGPQRGAHNFKKTSEELSALYTKALLEFRKVLKKGGVVLMVWPVFKQKNTTDDLQYLDCPDIPAYKKTTLLSPETFRSLNLKPSKNGGLIYGRKNQKVWREIIKFSI